MEQKQLRFITPSSTQIKHKSSQESSLRPQQLKVNEVTGRNTASFSSQGGSTFTGPKLQSGNSQPFILGRTQTLAMPQKIESLLKSSKPQIISEPSKVAIRLRPMTKKEVPSDATQILEVTNQSQLYDTLRDKHITLNPSIRVFGQAETSEGLYDAIQIEQSIWRSIESGTNLTLICFGNTGAGKSYTMTGNREKTPGFLPLALESIFAYIYQKVENEFIIKMSYIEIFNEQVNDLLSPSSVGSFIEKVSEEVITNIDQIFSLIRMGDINRSMGVTKTNERSAKAHIIYRLVIESFTYSENPSNSFVPTCTLNLVDLGGSEPLSQLDDFESRASQKQKEHSFQVKGIFTLETIVSILSDPNQIHDQTWVPYRESKLTRFLMPYLEGDSSIIWVCNVSPTDQNYRYNMRTCEFANKVSRIVQKISAKQVPLEDSTLYQVKKSIAIMKLRMSKLDLLISKKEQQLMNSSKGSASPHSQGSSRKLGSTLSQSLSVSIDMEIDEKLRTQNEIKKLQNQILVSDKISLIFKKFDKRRTQAREALQPFKLQPDVAQDHQQESRTSLFDRLSKKLDNARDFVRTSEASKQQDSVEKALNLSEAEQESQLRASRKSLSRRTLKKIQEFIESEEEKKSPEKIDDGEYQMGRLSLFDKILGEGSGEKPQNEEDLIRSSQDGGEDTPLLMDLDKVNEDPFLCAANLSPDPNTEYQQQSPIQYPEQEEVKELENLQDDDEPVSSDNDSINDEDQSAACLEKHYEAVEVDPYYSIKEEDEENEEDSFEIVKRREAREFRQEEFEKGIIEMGQSRGNIFKDDRMSKGSLQVKEGSENITPESEGMREEGKQGQLAKLPEMDQDMQNSFDNLLDGSPSVGLSQPKSPEQNALRKTLVKLTTSNLSAESIQRSSMNSKNCGFCREQSELRILAQTDKSFLEALLEVRDREIQALREELRKRDLENQALKRERGQFNSCENTEFKFEKSS